MFESSKIAELRVLRHSWEVEASTSQSSPYTFLNHARASACISHAKLFSSTLAISWCSSRFFFSTMFSGAACWRLWRSEQTEQENTLEWNHKCICSSEYEYHDVPCWAAAEVQLNTLDLGRPVGPTDRWPAPVSVPWRGANGWLCWEGWQGLWSLGEDHCTMFKYERLPRTDPRPALLELWWRESRRSQHEYPHIEQYTHAYSHNTYTHRNIHKRTCSHSRKQSCNHTHTHAH